MITLSTIIAAEAEAELATNKYLQEVGEHPFNCGFAWVEAKVRGNSKVGKMLKERGFKKPYVGTGLSLWNPSNSYTQDMSAKRAGAEAYAKVLRDAGIEIEVRSRLD